MDVIDDAMIIFWVRWVDDAWSYTLVNLIWLMSREGYELTGQKIQGYTISKPIGQGKFSIVYRA